jgi:hypothetical protein
MTTKFSYIRHLLYNNKVLFKYLNDMLKCVRNYFHLYIWFFDGLDRMGKPRARLKERFLS